MNANSPLPSSWYADPMWISSGGEMDSESNQTASPHLADVRIKGIPSATTPAWALHVGWPEDANAEEIRARLESSKPLVIIDLPPGVDVKWGQPWIGQRRHTRQLHWDTTDAGFDLEELLPAHRLKQIRKGTRSGLKVESTRDVDRVLALHQQARQRKQLSSNEGALRPLLEKIMQSPHQSAYIVLSNEGKDMASAVFLHERGRTIYAFGGQVRSKLSGLASVMLIDAGIRDAVQREINCFDFGGSMDPGVDKFYAEFGAEKVVKWRYLRCSWWARPWFRLMRPDLFRD